MNELPPVIMTFPTLDQAESALDWIGLDFEDAEGGFEGDLIPEDAELLAETLSDPETPLEVRALATQLRDLLARAVADGDEWATWRVGFAG